MNLRSNSKINAFAYLGIGFVPLLLGPDPSCYQTILDTVGQRREVVSFGSNITIFAKGVMQMLIKSPFQIRNGFHSGNGTHWDLLFPISIRNCRHFVRFWSWQCPSIGRQEWNEPGFRSKSVWEFALTSSSNMPESQDRGVTVLPDSKQYWRWRKVISSLEKCQIIIFDKANKFNWSWCRLVWTK